MALTDIITCPVLGMMTQFDQPKWHLLERYVSLQIRNPAINTTLHYIVLGVTYINVDVCL